jgi:hypothetical protein
MQYRHEGEQTFARFYANALASIVIINSNLKSPLFLKLGGKTENQFQLEENEELKKSLLLKLHGCRSDKK